MSSRIDAVKRIVERLVWLVLAAVIAMYAIVAYGFGKWALVAVGVVAPWDVDGICVADEAQKVQNVGGFDFSFEEVNCDVIGSQQAWMVYVSRHGRGERHILAVYGNATRLATATSNKPGTVWLSLGDTTGFYHKEERWRDLTVGYDYQLKR